MGKFFVLSWKIWQGDAATWDEMLMQFSDFNIYQSYGWGTHRSHLGWISHRLMATENGGTVAMAQVLVRRFPLDVALVWVPGGPVGLIETWGAAFRATVLQAIGVRHLYCRIYPTREKVGQDIRRMEREGWHRSDASINSGMSFAYVPSEEENARVARASVNWRHNLRRSLKYGHVVGVWTSPDPDEMLVAYEAMQFHKKLDQPISRSALISLLEVFGEQCIVVKCSDAQGRLLALRGALLFGNKAWDVLAAATPAGRKVYASHATFWELMKQCASRGVQWYDMGGADRGRGKGVYDYKKGTGASEIVYLGEWDWGTSPLLRRAANYLIKRRARGM